MNNKKLKAFTLVELIVVITILAILGTIAFISLQGYSSQSRDSTRISDISTMKIGLELFQLDAGKYPIPTDGTNITYSGAVVWNQGVFGDPTYKNVQKLDKVPKDPLTDSVYTYSVTATRNKFQISGILESGIASTIDFIDNSYAGTTTATAYVSGTYNGQTAKALSGATNTCTILSVPSIITNDLSVTDLETISNSGSYVRHGYNNLGDSFKNSKFDSKGGFDFKVNNIVAYTDTDNCSTITSGEDYTSRITLLKGIQNSYSGTILANDGEIGRIVNLVIDQADPSNEAINLAGSFVNNNFGGRVTISSTNVDTSLPVCKFDNAEAKFGECKFG